MDTVVDTAALSPGPTAGHSQNHAELVQDGPGPVQAPLQDQSTPQAPEPGVVYLPIAAAAAQLGVPIDTLRKRIRRRRLPAHKTADGRWLIAVPAAVTIQGEPRAVDPSVQDESMSSVLDHASPPSEDTTQGWSRTAAREMVQVVQDHGGDKGEPSRGVTRDATAEALVHLVAQLHEENRQLAGQCGFLQAQLEQTREQLRLLQAPSPEPAPTPEWDGVLAPKPRPWRRRLWPNARRA